MGVSVRQAITTKFLAPTNYRGARIKVMCEARTIVLGWNHALNVDANHAAAIVHMLRTLGWSNENYPGKWSMGALPGAGYVATYGDASTTLEV